MSNNDSGDSQSSIETASALFIGQRKEQCARVVFCTYVFVIQKVLRGNT
jgi:hypothetical protein